MSTPRAQDSRIASVMLPFPFFAAAPAGRTGGCAAGVILTTSARFGVILPRSHAPGFFSGGAVVTSLPLGILLLVLAGAMNGSFTLPMKFTRQWAWENTWLAWTIFALGIFPPLLTFSTISHPGAVYAQPGMAPFEMIVLACGAGWGASQVFFGLAVDAVGIALAFSVILGISAAVGSLIPLVREHPEKID